ncbi:MAG: 3-hydroxyacyl-CoA dehydrogenase family protein [Elusimicrobia bacterium]|nr:3-hydroxyacyl-CoA dehydrogenase family protein [Elusimicrobiota bacterium]
MRDISQVGVVGASGVGPALAQACLQAGLAVVLVDDTEEILSAAEDAVLRGLQRAEQPGVFSLMRKATRLERLEGCDLVVECGSETPQAKQDLLRRIDARTDRSCVIAVETDALPVSFTARYVENPDRVVGVHVPPPATIGRLVEVVRYEHAAPQSVERTLAWVERLGRRAVCAADKAGFVVNRLQRAWMAAAFRLLEAGRGTPASIDAAVRSAGGFPAGPFETIDARGLEADFHIGETIYELLGRPERLRPSAAHEKLLARGCRGRRNSRGFFVYGENPPGTVNPLLEELVPGLGARPAPAPEVVAAAADAAVAEARAIVDDGVAGPEDVETAAKLGLFWTKGPAKWAEERGR